MPKSLFSRRCFTANLQVLDAVVIFQQSPKRSWGGYYLTWEAEGFPRHNCVCTLQFSWSDHFKRRNCLNTSGIFTFPITYHNLERTWGGLCRHAVKQESSGQESSWSLKKFHSWTENSTASFLQVSVFWYKHFKRAKVKFCWQLHLSLKV